MHRRFVIYHTTKAKKNYCMMNLIKSTTAMQHIAWLKWYKIQIKRYLKDFLSLNLMSVVPYSSWMSQKTFVNLMKISELKNYFTILFQFTMSCCSIRSYYIFWYKHPLHTITLQKTIHFNELSLNFYTSQVWRYLK
jgi:hypothetical protein